MEKLHNPNVESYNLCQFKLCDYNSQFLGKKTCCRQELQITLKENHLSISFRRKKLHNHNVESYNLCQFKLWDYNCKFLERKLAVDNNYSLF